MDNSTSHASSVGTTAHRKDDAPRVILIVEDNDALRAAVAAYLELVGYRVLEARSAGEAVDAFRTELQIDLVCTDINMPGAMDGLGLAEWLAALRPSLPVVLTSGAEFLKAESAVPPRRFLRKPYPLAELETQIAALLAHSTTS